MRYVSSCNITISILNQAREYQAKKEEAEHRINALHQAVLENDVAMIPCAMKNLSNIKSKGIQIHYSPIYYAVLHGFHSLIEELIKYGADVNQKNRRGQSPLELAVFKNDFKIIQFLIEHGATGVNSLEVKSQINRFYQKNRLLCKILSMGSTNQLAYYSQNKKIKNLEHTIKSNGSFIVENQLKQRFREQLRKGEERYACLNVAITMIPETLCENTPNLPSELWSHILNFMTTAQIERLNHILMKMKRVP